MAADVLALGHLLGREGLGVAALAPLVAELASKDDEVRFHAVWAIAWIGPAAKDAAPAVIKALGDGNQEVRRKAAYALGRINADAKTIAPPLVKALERMPELAYDVLVRGNSSILQRDLANELQCICDAALTGTV